LRRSPRRPRAPGSQLAALLAAAALLTGCLASYPADQDASSPPDDAGLDDARVDDAHVADAGEGRDAAELPLADLGQRVIGREATFELATWNLHNFPEDEVTAARAAELLRELDLDLIGVQEISEATTLEAIAAGLGDFAAALSPGPCYSSGGCQKTGFLYRRGLLTLPGPLISLFTDDGNAFPRAPQQAQFLLRRPTGEQLPLIAIVVHLKAYPGEENEARRRLACNQLQRHIDKILGADPTAQVALLGDFNDELEDPQEDNVFTALLEHPEQYFFTTQDPSELGHWSYIPYRSFIDHILITTALEASFGSAVTLAVPLDRWVEEYSYREVISDHRPVVTRFRW